MKYHLYTSRFSSFASIFSRSHQFDDKCIADLRILVEMLVLKKFGKTSGRRLKNVREHETNLGELQKNCKELWENQKKKKKCKKLLVDVSESFRKI